MTQPVSKRLVTEARFTDISNAATAAAQSKIDASAAAASSSATAAQNSANLVGAPADTAIATAINGSGTQTQAAGDARWGGGGVTGQVRSKVKTDGTDQTATLQGELDSLRTAGGGTLVLPSGTITIAGTITLGNDGATPAKQPALRIVGQGGHWSGRGTAPVGGTTLDIKGTDTYGKLKTNGLGLLFVSGLTFRDSAGTNTPFLYTTNTTLHIDQCAFVGSKTGTTCDQDAIVCGGTTNVEGGNGWNDGFQGYGTVISRNFFSSIRRAVFGRTFFNGNVIRDNTIWNTCGNTAGPAIDIDGDSAGTAAGSKAVGNVVRDNLIELTNYKWGVRLGSTSVNTIAGNNTYDKGASTLAAIRCETNALNNIIFEGATPSGLTPVDDQATTKSYYIPSTGGVTGIMPPMDFPDASFPLRAYGLRVYGPSGLTFQPLATMADTGGVLIAKRGPSEATDPNGIVWQLQQNGQLTIGASAVSGGNVTGPFSKFTAGGRTWSGVGTATGQTNGAGMSQDSGPGGSYFDARNYAFRFNDHNSGPLRMRVGAGKDGFDLGAANDVTVQRDSKITLAVNVPIKALNTTTALMPTGTSVGISGVLFNTDIKKPLWSDGTNFRDARGYVTLLATKTTNYTHVDGDEIVVYNGASLTATLPDPTTVLVGKRWNVKNINASALTVVSAGTSKTIDGTASQSVAQWGKAEFVSDGTQWLTI